VLGTLHLRQHRGSGGGLPARDVRVEAAAAAWGGGKGATKECAPARVEERPWGGGRGAAKEPEQMPTRVRSNNLEFG